MATLNIGMKVNRAITGATTVTANAMAMVTYIATAASGAGTGGNTICVPIPPLVRTFGPGQSIPASFSVSALSAAATLGVTGSITYTLQSGFELINTI